ncbi:putative S-layer protein [Synechococcus sp. PCC 7502]|uniref:iron uptake porin n=1 Tax=Synechococcus sp. PCC 7502 TaxID=1173263 RepID=UPI00029FA5A7|nr:iron uptake porin [Synechococcus sp. PCC 7502]AFY73622.1 putative S-layer protein [Synechococcus sp. PCC 7502]
MSKSRLGFLVAAIATTSVLGVSTASAAPESGTGTQLIQNMNRDALIANPTILQNTNAQVTSVSQFSDVQPTDWAFTALQSLVERYGCIAGYPDSTYRGSRALSRYEFAAGLNACLDKINELISSGLADKVGKEDLATLQKLQEEFSAELAALKGRVTALESKTATLEAQQFSTTTKLTGSVIFTGAGSFGDNSAVDGNRNITFAGRTRLNFNTSFGGKDLLFIRLQAGNIPNNAGGNLLRLAFDENTATAAGGSTLNVQLDRLYYRFPLTNQINLLVGTTVNIEDVLDVSNPDLLSSETGSISRFARRDPLIFRGQGDGNAAAAVKIKFNDQFGLNIAYLANQAQNPSTVLADAGVFGGGYTGAVQVLFTPFKPLALSFVYERTYDPSPTNLSSGTGTSLANTTYGLASVGGSADRFGFQLNYNFSPNLSFNGRVSYATTRAVSGDTTADILSWLTSITFKDLFVQGNQASIAFGQPPYVVGGNIARADSSQNPYHIEAFYRFQLSKNISITPGLITVLNPGTITGGGVDNRPEFVGVLRTSLTF